MKRTGSVDPRVQSGECDWSVEMPRFVRCFSSFFSSGEFDVASLCLHSNIYRNDLYVYSLLVFTSQGVYELEKYRIR